MARRTVGAAMLTLVAVATFVFATASPNRPLGDAVWRGAVLVGGVSAAIAARRRNGTNWVFVAMIVLAATRMALIDNHELAFSIRDATWSQAIADAIANPLLLGTLLLMLRMRRGHLGWRFRLDIVSVALAAGLAAWMAVANPMWESGSSLALAVVAASGLPMAFLFVATSLELLLDGLVRNRAMQLLVVATVVNLVAGSARAGIGPGTGAQLWITVVVGTYAVAFLLGCAAMCDPAAPDIVRPYADPVIDPRREVLRLAPFAFALMLVGYLGSVVAPTSSADGAVQAVLVAAVVVAVLARLWSALTISFRSQLRLEQRLHTDDLTGLPNRARLVQLVATMLDDQWRAGAGPTLVQVSIDRFKQLNNSLGHANANRLLVGVAERLSTLAGTTGAVVARSGGDEFMVVSRSATSENDAIAICDEIVAQLARPFTIDGSPVFVTASIGVALVPRHRTVSAEDLVQHADIATHRAKATGRNRVVLFDDSMRAQLAHRMEVEHALHGALERRELLLYHQPIVGITDGSLSGFEALIRWRRADGTLVSPAEFIPIAEETGMINEMGAWALREALSHLAGWTNDGVVGPHTTMSVNVSPRQIGDPRFPDAVAEALEITGVAPHRLWLEVTESMMLQEPELALMTLRRIRAMGVRLALDDFGTGFSSLSMLQRFPIQRIKIDRAFVQGLTEQGSDRSLVRTIVAMAQSLGLDLVAEGVEEVAQLRALGELGCDRAQGFLISRPMPVEAVPSTVRAIVEAPVTGVFDTRRSPMTASAAATTAARSTPPDAAAGSQRPLMAPLA